MWTMPQLLLIWTQVCSNCNRCFNFQTLKMASLFVLDLTSLFTWNTKQLFLYITAEYESKQNVRIDDI